MSQSHELHRSADGMEWRHQQWDPNTTSSETYQYQPDLSHKYRSVQNYLQKYGTKGKLTHHANHNAQTKSFGPVQTPNANRVWNRDRETYRAVRLRDRLREERQRKRTPVVMNPDEFQRQNYHQSSTSPYGPSRYRPTQASETDRSLLWSKSSVQIESHEIKPHTQQDPQVNPARPSLSSQVSPSTSTGTQYRDMNRSQSQINVAPVPTYGNAPTGKAGSAVAPLQHGQKVQAASERPSYHNMHRAVGGSNWRRASELTHGRPRVNQGRPASWPNSYEQQVSGVLRPTVLQDSPPFAYKSLHSLQSANSTKSRAMRNTATSFSTRWSALHSKKLIDSRVSEAGDLPRVLANINAIPQGGVNTRAGATQKSVEESSRSGQFEQHTHYQYPSTLAPRSQDVLEQRKMRANPFFDNYLMPTDSVVEVSTERLYSLPSTPKECDYTTSLAKFWHESLQMGDTPETLLANFVGQVRSLQCFSGLFNSESGGMIWSVLWEPKEYDILGKLLYKERLVGELRRNAPVSCDDDPCLWLERQVLFLSEITRRCIYIACFLRGERRTVGGLEILGPDLAFDCWIFETGILREAMNDSGRFDPRHDDLVHMYGLGKAELRWLQNNPVKKEYYEQVHTLESYHHLKSSLGLDAVKDIREQFCFCFFAIRDAREAYKRCDDIVESIKQQALDRSSSEQQGLERKYIKLQNLEHQRLQRLQVRRGMIAARRCEFKIAKIMIDRVWEEVNQYGKRITVPYHRNGQRLSNYQCPPASSNWDQLCDKEKKRLLGGMVWKNATEILHPEHPEFKELARLWLRDDLLDASANGLTDEGVVHSSSATLSATPPTLNPVTSSMKTSYDTTLLQHTSPTMPLPNLTALLETLSTDLAPPTSGETPTLRPLPPRTGWLYEMKTEPLFSPGTKVFTPPVSTRPSKWAKLWAKNE